MLKLFKNGKELNFSRSKKKITVVNGDKYLLIDDNIKLSPKNIKYKKTDKDLQIYSESTDEVLVSFDNYFAAEDVKIYGVLENSSSQSLTELATFDGSGSSKALQIEYTFNESSSIMALTNSTNSLMMLTPLQVAGVAGAGVFGIAAAGGGGGDSGSTTPNAQQAAMSKIKNFDPTNPPTRQDYADAGVDIGSAKTDDESFNLLTDTLTHTNHTFVDFTTAKTTIENLVSIVDKVMDIASGGASDISLGDLTALGLTNVTNDKITYLKTAIEATADNGSGVDTQSELQALINSITVISGSITAGPIVENSNLEIQAYIYNGTETVSLGVVTVDSTGHYKFATYKAYTGTLLLKVVDTNGANPDYVDEATNAPTDLNGQVLRAVSTVNGFGEYVVNITPLTELATKQMGVTDTTPPTNSVAVDAVNSAVSKLFGVESIVSTQPVAINDTNFSTANAKSKQYGEVLAALSGMDKENGGSVTTTLEILSQAITSNVEVTTVTQVSDLNYAWKLDLSGTQAQDSLASGATATNVASTILTKILKADISIGSDGKTVVTGTASSNVNVNITFPDGTKQSTKTGNDGHFTLTSNNIQPEGKVTITSTDDNGNVLSSAQGTQDENTPSNDNAAPNTPTGVGLIVNTNGKLVITGSAEPGSKITVTLPDGTTQTGTTDKNGMFSITTTKSQPFGDVVVKATDTSGNASGSTTAPFSSSTTNNDVTPPAKPTFTISTDTDGKLVAKGSAEEGSTVDVTFPDGTHKTVIADSNGNFSMTSDTVQTTGSVTANAKDAKGNTSENITITYQATITDVETSIDQDGKVVITGKAPANDTMEVTFPDGTKKSITSDGDGNFTITSDTPQPAGEFVVDSGDGVPVKGKIDTATPSNDYTAPEYISLAIKVTADGKLQASGKAESNSKVVITLPDGTTATATADKDGNYTYTSTAIQPFGVVSAIATDISGNSSGDTTQVYSSTTDSSDKSAPGLPTIVLSTQSAGLLMVSGKSEPYSKITITLPDGTTAVATTNKDGEYTYTSTTPQPLGIVKANATDISGNTSNNAIGKYTTTTTSSDTTAPDTPSMTTVIEPDQKITIKGTSEAGSSVTVTFADGTTKTVTAGADGSYSVTSDTVQPSIGFNSVVSKDASGNTSNTVQENYHITITGVTAQIDPDGVVVITGKAPAGGTLDVTFPDGTKKTVTANGGGDFYISSDTPQPSGNFVVDGGDGSPVKGTIDSGTPTADTTAPNDPTIVLSVDSSGKLQISGSAEAGSKITITLPDSSTVTTTTDKDGHYSYTSTTTQPFGEVKAKATDASGNASGDATQTYSKALLDAHTIISSDTTAPNAPTVFLATQVDGKLSVKGVAEAYSSVTVTFVDSTTKTVTADKNGAYTLLSDTPQPQGVVKASATDASGNISADGSATYSSSTTTLDKKAPNDPTVILQETTDGKLTISGKAEAGSKITMTLPDGTSVTTTTDKNGNYTYTTGSSQQTGDVKVKASDASGNSSNDVTSHHIHAIQDTTAPTATITLNDTALKVGETSTVTITFSEEVSEFDLADLAAENGTLSNLTQSIIDAKVYTATFTPATKITDTTNIISLASTYTDKANNAGTAATSANYTIDTTPPPAPSISFATDSGSSNSDGNTNNGAISVGSLESGTTWEYSTNGGATWTTGNGASFTLAVGSYDVGSVKVRQSDTAGNVSAISSNEVAYVVDTSITAPTITSSMITNSIVPSLSGTAEAGSTVSIEIGSAIYTTTANSSGNWTIDTGKNPASGTLNLNTNGGNSVTIFATDIAGNISTVDTQTLIVDTTAPSAPTITLGTGIANGASAIEATQGGGVVTVNAEVGSSITVAFTNGAHTVTKTLIGTGGPQPVTLDAADLNTLGDGAIQVSATQADMAGNIQTTAASTISFMLDTTAPSISNVALTSSSGIDGTYKIGDVVTATVAFDEAININTIGGTPQLALNIGGKAVSADFVSISGNALTFNYTIQSGDLSTDGISISQNSLFFNGAIIKDVAGNDASPLHAALASSNAHLVDGVAPSIASTTPADSSSTPATTYVGPSDNLSIKFDSAVQKGTGNIKIIMDDGSNATTTIAVNDAAITISGDTVTINPPSNLTLNKDYHIEIDAGAITDLVGNPFAGISDATTWNFRVPDPAIGLNTIAGDNRINGTDNSAPIVLSGSVSSTEGANIVGAFVAGDITITLVPVGGGATISVSSSDITYNATTGAWSGSVPANTLVDGNSYTINVGISKTGVGSASTSSSVTVDTTAPSVTGVEISSATGSQNGFLNAGDVVMASVVFDDVVSVTGAPNLELNIGGVPVQASFISGSGTNTLRFSYTIQANQTDANGISVDANKLTLNGGTISDIAGNNAVLTHLAVTDNSSFKVDTTAPSILTLSLATDTGTSSSDGVTKVNTINVGGIETGASWEYSVDGGNSWSAGLGSSFSVNSGSYNAGALQVRQIDLAGNVSTVGSNSSSIVVDTTGPVAPTLTLAIDSGSGANDRITNIGTVQVGNLDAGASWEYSVDGGSNWSAGSGSSFTLAQGSYAVDDIKVRQIDLAGNAGVDGSNTASIVVDTTAPSASTLSLATDSGSSGSDGITKVGVVNVTGLEANTPWQYSVDSGANWIDGSGTSFVLDEGSYGANTLRVRQTDLAGNTGTAGNTGAIKVDISGPTSPTISSPSATNSSAPILTGTAEAGSVLKVTIAGATYSTAVDSSGSWSVNTQTATPISGTLNLNTNGDNAVSIVATDAAGNTSGATTATLTIDAVAPSAVVLTLGDGISDVASSTEASQSGGVATISAEAGASVTVTFTNGSHTVIKTLTGTGSSQPVTLSLADLATLGDGTIQVSATQTDKAGNVQTVAAATTSFTLDTTVSAPALALASDSATSGDGITNVGTVNVSGVENGASWLYSVDGGTNWTSGSGTSFMLNAGVYNVGDIKVKQIDTAGNISTAGSNASAITVDITAAIPMLSLATDSGGISTDGITNVGTINVGSLETGASWQYSSDGGNTWTNGSGSSFSLSTGTYAANTIQVKQTDKAGNTSSIGFNTSAITVDTTASSAQTIALATDSGGSSTDGITNVGTISVSGLESGATWQYSTNGGTSWTTGSGVSFSLSTGTYAANVVQVRQTDLAGNTGSVVSNSSAITVDTTAAAPTLSLATDSGISATDGITNIGTVNVSGLESGASWQYSTDSGSTWTSGAGTSFTLSVGDYAANTVQVKQTDKAGNISSVGSNTSAITVDTTASSAQTIALAIDSGSSSTDGITNVGTINVNGLEGGATWQYSTNGGSTWTNGTGTSFTLSAGTYAANAIQVKQTDIAGNTGAVVSNAAAITVDAAAPSAPTLSLATDSGGDSTDGITNVGTVNVGGLEGGASWQYSADSGNTWTNGTGTSFTLSAGTYAANAVQVKQTDLAGNTGLAVSNATTITVDTTAAAPAISLATDSGANSSDGITNVGTVNISSLETGASWQYSTDGGNTWTNGTGTSFTLSAGTYAANAIQAKQTDVAGNIGTVGSNASTVKVDATAATISSVTIVSATGMQNSLLNAGDVVTASVSFDEVVFVTGTPQLELNIGGTAVLANYASGSGSNMLDFTYTILTTQTDANGISIDANKLTLNGGTIKDTAGNDATLTHLQVADNASFKVDTTATTPTLSLATDSGSNNSDGITNVSTVNVGALETGASWQYSTDNGSTWHAGTGSSFSLSAGTYASGTVKVKQTDEAGNTSSVGSSSSAITVDITAPTATLTAATLGYNQTSVTVRSSEIGTAYLVSSSVAVDTLADITGAAGDKWNQVSITTANTNTTLSTTGLASGDYKLYTVDKAGNISSASNNTVTILPDTINLGSNYGGSGVNLNLIHPAVINGKVYYMLDQTGNGAISTSGSDDRINHDLLDSLLNSGSDTTNTQTTGNGASAGVDDGRTVVINGYTIVLPTIDELIAINTATSGVIPAGWDYGQGVWSSTNYASNDHYYRSNNNTVTAHITDTAGGLVIFQVLTADSTPSTIMTVEVTTATGIQNSLLNAGDVVTASVSFDEVVFVTGTPQLELNIGGTAVLANYASGSGSNMLDFTYTILTTQTDANGISIDANKLTLNGGTIKDASNNNATLTHSAVADNASFKVDTTASSAQTIALATDSGTSNSDRITNDGTINVSSLEAGATWQYSTDGGTNWYDGVGTSFTLGSGTFAIGSIQVKQTDLAGNTGTVVSNAAAITVDTTVSAPTFALATDSGSSSSDGITNVGTINIAGLESGASWQYSTDSGTSWTNGSGTSFTLNAGTYDASVVQVKQTDSAGNTSIISSSTSAITVDTTAPSAQTLSLHTDSGTSNSDRITNVGTVDVAGLESGATWQYSTDSGSTWTNGTGTSFSLVTGTYAIGAVQVKQTDLAGNLGSEVSNAASFTVDTTVSTPTLALATDSGSSNSDGITNVGTINVAGLESGASWQYSSDNGTSWTNGSGTSFTLTAGMYTIGAIQVKQIDIAGNVSTTGTNASAITVDATASSAQTISLATDSGNNSTDGVTNVGTVNVAGLESGASWQYSTNGGTSWTNGTGTSFTLSAGTYAAGKVQVKQIDLAGNLGSAVSNAAAITVDTTISTPTLALATDSGGSNSDSITNVGTINITGLESGASWQYSVDSGSTWTNGTGTSFTLANGTYAANAVQVRQTDVAGNTSSDGNYTSALTIDTTAPATLTFALASDTGIFNNDNITKTGTVNVAGLESGASWQYSVNGGTSWTAGSGNSFTLASGATYAINAVQVRQIDTAGNLSTIATNSASITIDTTAPLAPTMTQVVDSASGTVIINVSGLETNANWEYSTDNGTNWTSGSGSSFVLSSGTYAIGVVKVRQIDTAGNTGNSASNTAIITLDTTPPVAPTLSLSSDTGASDTDGVTKNNIISVGGLESGATWQYSKDGGVTWLNGNGSTFTLGSGTFAAGKVQVKQTDAAGNVSTIGSNATVFTIDWTAPVAPTINNLNGLNTINAFDAGYIAVTGTAEANATVSLTIGGSVKTLAADSAGNWSYTPTSADYVAMGEGAEILSATQTDLAGNVSPSATKNITVKTTTVELAAMTTSVAGGFVILGQFASDYSGSSVSSAGDVNGDGLADLIVGAPYSDPAAGSNAGRSYVVFGKTDGNVVKLADVAGGTGGFVINGQASGDSSGISVSSAGDINGDGLADVIVSSIYATVNSKTLVGRSYVVFGKNNGTAVNLSAIVAGTGGFVINGESANDRLGSSVSSAGDINGDGLTDLIVGASNGNKSYVVFGKTGTDTVNLSAVAGGTGGFVINAQGANDQSGRSVSSAGDVNGDGLADIIVGADWSNPAAGAEAGRSYVIFGKTGVEAVNLSAIAGGTGGFVINGQCASDHSGMSVSSAGDVNGDGFADLIVGAYLSDPATLNGAGRSYVVFGKAGTTAIDLSAIAGGTGGFVINGQASVDYSGYSVSSAGDMNGDGLADLIVGAYKASPNTFTSSAGQSYVIFGKTTTGAIELSTIAATSGASGGFVINGGSANDNSGNSVSAAGDVNGDGLADIIVGASNAGVYSGKSYVIFGNTAGVFANTTVDAMGTSGADNMSDGGVAKTLAGNAGDDTFTATAASILYGGTGNDTFVIDNAMITALQSPFGSGGNTAQLSRIDGGTGLDTISLSGSSLTLDLTQVANQAGANPDGGSRIDSVERIDITGSGNNTLRLSSRDVIDMSGMNIVNATTGSFANGTYTLKAAETAHQLIIDGDSGDTVNVTDGMWENAGTITKGGNTYRVYKDATSATQLIVDSDISTTVSMDTVSPTISSIAITSAYIPLGNYVNTGDVVTITATFSEAVVVSGSPTLALNIGGTTVQASYASGSGTSSVKFAYTILATQTDTDGISIDANSLSLNGGAITDKSGNIAILTHSAVADNSSYMVDTVASPVVLALGDGIANGAFAGEMIQSSGVVTVTGEVGAMISVKFANGSKSVTKTLTGTGSAQAVVLATAEATSLGEGTIIVSATQIDAAGNASTQTTTSFVSIIPVINLSTIASGIGGFVINGQASGNLSGQSVSSAGDVNGDGLADFIVGAPSSNTATGIRAGRSYVVFGQTGTTAVELSNIAATSGASGGFVINGQTKYDLSGNVISSAGDVNGDGLADLIIGVPSSYANTGTSTGRSYVVFGKTTTTAIDLSAVASGIGGFIINGQCVVDSSGNSVSSAGDVNGDGLADLIVGASYSDPAAGTNAGRSYVVFGKTSGTAIDLSAIVGGTGGFVINGQYASGNSGYSVSSAGDVNGDGLVDLVVGSAGYEKSYVVFGKADTAAIDLSAIAGGTGGFVINGDVGACVSSVGDVNGDGLADFIVGARDTNPLGTAPVGAEAGRSYVIFGKTGVEAVNLSAIAGGTGGFVINGQCASDYSGASVSSAGDMNGDGLADLIVGAPGSDPAAGKIAGRSYVVFGKTATAAIELSAVANGVGGFVINGQASGDYSGNSVSSAGDVNGDGLADLIIGAPNSSPATGANAGRSYVIFGSTTGVFGNTSVDVMGTTGADVLSDDGAAKTLVGDAGDDVMSATAASILYGGSGNDTFVIDSAMITALQSPFGSGGNISRLARIDGGSGVDTIKLSGSALTLDLTLVANQAGTNPDGGSRIDSIERIDITGSGNNTLKLTAKDVADMSGMNTINATTGGFTSALYTLKATESVHQLVVDGNAGDALNMSDGTWSYNGTLTKGGNSYKVYSDTKKASQLIVDSDITVTMIDTIVPSPVVLRLGSRVSNGATSTELLQSSGVVTVTGEAGATITVTFTNGGATVTKTLTGTGNVQAVVLTAANATTLGLGTIQVSASQTDAGGNVQAGGATTASFAAYNPVIELSSIAGGTGGFVINGQASGDYSGWSVSGAGDVNGDGLADIIVGAINSDPASGSNAGRSYVVFGKSTSTAINLSAIAGGTGGFVINGQASSDASGVSVSSAGDVNGDGLADLIIGAYSSDPAAGVNAGRSYVVFGKSTTTAVNLSAVAGGTGGFVINGQASGDASGTSVSSAGDVNGDGLADLIIGANMSDPATGSNAGRSYVVFGQTGTTAIDLSKIAATSGASGGFVINGQASNDQSGYSVSSAGDVNGDGLADLIIGASSSDPAAGADAGRSYVVFGKTTTTAINLSAIAGGTGGFVINGQASGDYSGWSVSYAGDVNGDGLADLIIGAKNSGPATGANAGRSYVVFGKSTTTAIDLSAIAGGTGGFVINGQASGDSSGVSVSSAGDMNGDGLADLIIGAKLSDPAVGQNAGRSYVVFGKADGVSVELSSLGNYGVVINGQIGQDQSGCSVSSAGDVNGDGLADLIIGAQMSSPAAGSNAGRSYVIFGSTTGAFENTAVDVIGTSAADTLSDDGIAKTLVGGAGDDTFTATAASILYGGSGNDTFVIDGDMIDGLGSLNLSRIDGGSGKDTIKLSGANLYFSLTNIANQAGGNPDGGSRIDSVEKIDLTGTGYNTLRLTAKDVIDMSEANIFATTGRYQLLVTGDSGDKIDLDDNSGTTGWTKATATATIDSVVCNVWTHNSYLATIYAQTTLSVI